MLAVSAGVLTAGCSLPGTSTSTPTPLDRQALERVAGQALDPPPAIDDHSFVGGHAHDGRS
ncbi:MAG: hypothetical protein V5A61_06025 [Haloarculaceae archaeon]